MELRKIYSRVGIHKLMELVFSTFVIYYSLKLQIDNPLGVLLGFAQVLNRSLYHFTIKINGFPSVTSVSFDRPAPNITLSSAKSSIERKTKKQKTQL
jgi:hypothetical protein